MNRRTVSRLPVGGLVALSCLLLPGCAATNSDAVAQSKPTLQSIFTDIGAGSCRNEIDKTDPNETPYLACAGVAGYTLIVRRVGAGRRSIDVVDAAQHVFPPNLQESVTRHMFTLGDQAEWRVETEDGMQVPVALIVRVQAHEDNNDPEKVTRTYVAVAKITPDEACVTERFTEGTQPEGEVRNAADLARERPCAPPQPPLTADGVVIR